MNKKMTNVLELIDYLEQTAKSSGNILGKVSFNKNELIKLISEVKENLPEEFVEAASIVKSADEIILNARKEAAIIEEEAKRAVKREYENSKILKAAQKEATEILEEANMKAREIKTEANKYSKEMKASAINYVDTTLSKLQKEIDVKSESRHLRK